MLIFSLVHATNDGFTVSSCGVAVGMVVPGERQASAQGLLGGVETLVAGITATVIGQVYEHFGRTVAYTSCAAAMLALIICGAVSSGSAWGLRDTSQQPTPSPSDTSDCRASHRISGCTGHVVPGLVWRPDRLRSTSSEAAFARDVVDGDRRGDRFDVAVGRSASARLRDARRGLLGSPTARTALRGSSSMGSAAKVYSRHPASARELRIMSTRLARNCRVLLGSNWNVPPTTTMVSPTSRRRTGTSACREWPQARR